MTNQDTNHLEMRWIPVVDGSGREHMECVWVDVAAVSAGAHAA